MRKKNREIFNHATMAALKHNLLKKKQQLKNF
jgi:hypothetical protein